MTKVVFIVLIVLSVNISRAAEPAHPPASTTTGLITRTYNVQPVMIGCRFSSVGDATNDFHAVGNAAEADSSGLKDFFAEFGMTWPEGSSIRHLVSMHKLIVRNTHENMAICEQVLLTLNVVPNQIDIEMQLVEFSQSDVEMLAKKGPVDIDALMDLRRAGKGKLLYAPKVVTQSGAQATIKGVTEVIYPTEFCCFSGGDSNSSSAISGALPVAEPGVFELREVGAILQVLAEVSSYGACINLTLTPQVVNDPTWRNYGPQNVATSSVQPTANMQMPFFFTQSLTQSMSLFNGATVLAGGGIPSKDKDRVVYVFVSAQQIDPEGKPFRGRRDIVPEIGGRP